MEKRLLMRNDSLMSINLALKQAVVGNKTPGLTYRD